ncbi:MAG: sugar transferase [Actinomycetia bacterium]|nr:sugar transferase [Actinomycetes bacterium]MCP4959181.1 sugar transferase [Actinomycetes bacterium]
MTASVHVNEIMQPRRTGFGASTFRHPTRASSLILFGFDIVATACAFPLFRWTLKRGVPFAVLMVLLLLIRGHYRTRMSRDFGEDMATLLSALAAVSLTVIVVIGVSGIRPPTPSTVVAASAGLLAILLASRWCSFRVLRFARKRGHLRSRAIVVGTGSVARELGVDFDHKPGYGVDIAGYVATRGLESQCVLPGPIIGNIKHIVRLTSLTNSDRVIVTVGQGDDEQVLNALRQLPVPGVAVFVLPQVFGWAHDIDPMNPDQARGYSLVRLARSSHPVLGLRFKRLFDISCSGLALTILSPLVLATAFAVKLTSKGSVLFRQQRIGRYGLPFELLKFRSMTVNTDSDSVWTPSSSEASLTPIGRFIRWSSLDELPQLWNILRGEMSFVGPRPERPAFVDDFSVSVAGYVHRHRLPVGLTGLAQVRGLRGDTPMDERVRMDNLYIDEWSFFSDLRLIVQTVWAIIRQGAYAEAHVDVEAALVSVGSGDQVVVDLVANDRAERPTRCSQ